MGGCVIRRGSRGCCTKVKGIDVEDFIFLPILHLCISVGWGKLRFQPVFVLAMTRDIFHVTKKPKLRRKWVNIIVKYIREHYGGDPPADVDAIVDPDTRGFVFAIVVASRLRLPYIPVHKAGEIPADPDDIIQNTYINRKNEVNFFEQSLMLLFYYCLVCQLEF